MWVDNWGNRHRDSFEKKVERAMGIEPTLVAWERPPHVSGISKLTE
jgi:hypothetical protein